MEGLKTNQWGFLVDLKVLGGGAERKTQPGEERVTQEEGKPRMSPIGYLWTTL